MEDFSIVLKQRTQASQKKKKIKDGKNVGYKREEMRNEVRKDGEQELGKGKVSKRDSNSSGLLIVERWADDG